MRHTLLFILSPILKIGQYLNFKSSLTVHTRENESLSFIVNILFLKSLIFFKEYCRSHLSTYFTIHIKYLLSDKYSSSFYLLGNYHRYIYLQSSILSRCPIITGMWQISTQILSRCQRTPFTCDQCGSCYFHVEKVDKN